MQLFILLYQLFIMILAIGVPLSAVILVCKVLMFVLN
jgi:hypothetical protein